MDVGLFVGLVACHLYFSSSRRSDDKDDDKDDEQLRLQQALRAGTSLNASEAVCIVTKDNEPILLNNSGDKPTTRAEMRLQKLWHRATYIIIRHEPPHIEQHGNDPSDVHVLVQRRSHLKDYCPSKLDPTPGGVVEYGESYRDNAIRELEEEMGIIVCSTTEDDKSNNSSNSINALLRERLFTFPYQDERVKVWGELKECIYRGPLKDLKLQESEVTSVERMSLQALYDLMEQRPKDFMPDSLHAMMLYRQRQEDVRVNRRLLHGYSSSNLYNYKKRPKLKAIFFDCDDCLYKDDWKVAKLLTQKIEDWCLAHKLRPGQAYELYKQYGTALRGLLAEGYLDDSPQAIDEYLIAVHDLPIHKLIPRDDKLRQMLQAMDPSIPRYIFTASVHHHAQRCLEALGIADLFLADDDYEAKKNTANAIIDCKACHLETKHSRHSFEQAMKIAGVEHPEECLLLDDSLSNVRAAREMGWRSVLVGRVGRDCGKPISTEHAELEIDTIHHVQDVLPELFVSSSSN